MAISIRLEKETEQRLELLATKTGRTKSYYLREMIEQGLDDLEDIYLADQALEAMRSGKSRTYSSLEVRKELGLDN